MDWRVWVRACQANRADRSLAAMTPYQIAQEVENAFDNRDRDAMHRFLARLVAMADAKLRPPDTEPPSNPTLEPSD